MNEEQITTENNITFDRISKLNEKCENFLGEFNNVVRMNYEGCSEVCMYTIMIPKGLDHNILAKEFPVLDNIVNISKRVEYMKNQIYENLHEAYNMKGFYSCNKSVIEQRLRESYVTCVDLKKSIEELDINIKKFLPYIVKVVMIDDGWVIQITEDAERKNIGSFLETFNIPGYVEGGSVSEFEFKSFAEELYNAYSKRINGGTNK